MSETNSTTDSATTVSSRWRAGTSKWWTTLPSGSWYAKTRDRGVVASSKRRQRCTLSVRGCMRTSITLSLTGASYRKWVRW